MIKWLVFAKIALEALYNNFAIKNDTSGKQGQEEHSAMLKLVYYLGPFSYCQLLLRLVQRFSNSTARPSRGARYNTGGGPYDPGNRYTNILI